MAQERDPQETDASSQPDETQVSQQQENGADETVASEQPQRDGSDETQVSEQPDGDETGEQGGRSGRAEENIMAPSMGPGTQVVREPPEERLARHEQSVIDAMGHDKRRPVVGGTYGPTKTKQATLYGIVLAVVVALGIGGVIVANQLDQPPESNPDKAPWTDNEKRPRAIQ